MDAYLGEYNIYIFLITFPIRFPVNIQSDIMSVPNNKDILNFYSAPFIISQLHPGCLCVFHFITRGEKIIERQ